MDNRVMAKHTDLAIEVRESFPEDSVEIDGVCLEKHTLAGGELLVTRVIIKDQHGAEQMGKPVGDYFTLEFQSLEAQETIQKEIYKILESLFQGITSKIYKILDCLLPVKDHLSVLVTGLGNRFATPDALGPYVVEHIQVNRHLETDPAVMFSAVIPGVMAQTGIESGEILGGIINTVKPDVLLVVDALATSSVRRLCHTIQITDTGISPGAGIGNHRFPVNQETMGIPVIAIGVPTVVDANTIVINTMEEFLQKEGLAEQDIDTFLRDISKQSIQDLFVTPKDIEMQIREIGKLIAGGIDQFQSGME